MKKSILILGFIICINMQSKAQQQSQFIVATGYNTAKPVSLSAIYYSGPDKDYDYYMRKKKNNLTAGLVTLGAGLVLSGIGLITASNSTNIDTDATAAVLLIAGAASGIASIPLMIMANVYGHKARLMLKNQKTGFGVPPNMSQDITGITLQIPLGK